ncbi:hypothetical protein [Nonomuraea typhae]|uniref:Uncharacterized protein n=1 Tax=Nonomuraea typhae TaxID=2603600 RepID=A0ABW7Z8P5_9ACTN
MRVSTTDSAVFRLDVAAKNLRGFSRAIAGHGGPGQPDLVSAVTATAEPTFFQPVRNRGCMTGPTTGGVHPAEIAGMWTTIKWPLEGAQNHLMHQVEIHGGGQRFCAKGDSGSLVLDAHEPTALGVSVVWA